MSDTTAQPEVFEYQAEMQKLLDILVHSLYTEREIFLRELISNASDALSKVQFTTLTESEVADKDVDLDIRIAFDDQLNTIEVIDSGCGMTREELVQNLGTIASSGTLRFLQEAKERNQSAENLIGQFGVGFYSVFMVAQKVEVTTRSWRPDAQGWQWISEGSGSYTLAPQEVRSRGTRILLHLKEEAKEFCKEYRIESIVKKYSNYVPFPVKLKDRTLNQVKALWTQPKSEVEDKEYEEFYKQITHDHQTPLHRLHFSIDAPIQFHALLYVPEQVTNEVRYAKEGLGLALYAQKVMIESGNTKLLPPFLRFVRGVVDSEDLPLNVLKSGESIAIAPDGPLGPPLEAKPGIVLLAKQAKVPILPWSYTCKREWRLKTWDRHRLPQPFNRIEGAFGEPLLVPPDSPPNEIPRYCRKLEDAMRRVSYELRS